jgi:hypothetical protein
MRFHTPINFVQTEIYYYKANRTTGIALHSQKRLFAHVIKLQLLSSIFYAMFQLILHAILETK